MLILKFIKKFWSFTNYPYVVICEKRGERFPIIYVLLTVEQVS